MQKYDIEKYFSKQDESSKFIVTKLFQKNKKKNCFFINNKNEELEVFFKTVNFIEIPDDAFINIGIFTYYKGVIHFVVKIFEDEDLLDVKKFSFSFAEDLSEDDLSYLVSIVENEYIIFNYFIIEDNEIDIYKRIGVDLNEKEVKKLKKSIEKFYSVRKQNNKDSDFLYSFDVFEYQDLFKKYHVYEIELAENEEIINIEKIKRDLHKLENTLIISGVWEDDNYIISNKDISEYISDKIINKSILDKLYFYFFNIDYYIDGSNIFSIYNDVLTNVKIKYLCYDKNYYDFLYKYDKSQKINIVLDNNSYDYYLLKEAFLLEKDHMKKIFFAINLLDFSNDKDFEMIMDFLVKNNLDEYHLKYIAKRISREHADKYKNYLEQTEQTDERINYNLENLSNYVMFYNRIFKLYYLLDHYKLEEIENISELLISTLMDYSYEFLTTIITLDVEKLKEVFSIINKKNLEKYLKTLRDEGKKEEEINLMIMDLKQSFLDIISTLDDDNKYDLIEDSIKKLFY